MQLDCFPSSFLSPPVCRTVLELGSGVGLTGVTICRSCSPNRFVFSDCHSSVLHKLRSNVQLNGLTEPTVSVEEMDWTAATEEHIIRIGPDAVIAAGQSSDSSSVHTLLTVCLK